jgi:hypothetical protein
VKSSQQDIELLNALLRGELDAAAKSGMEKRIAAEKDLAEDWEFLQSTAVAARVNALIDKQKMLQKHEAESVGTLGSGRKRWWWLALLLAMILLLLFALNKIRAKDDRLTHHEVFVTHFDSELILHKTYRSENNQEPLSIDQQRAYEMYSLQLFDDAIPLLEKLWEVERDTLALFYLGVSYYGVGDEEKGRETLNTDELSQYRDKIDIFNNPEFKY